MKASELKILHINCNYMGTRLHQIMVEHLDDCVAENHVFAPIRPNAVKATTPNENVTVSECFTYLDRFVYYRKQKKIRTSLETKIDVSGFNLIHAYTLFTDGNCACKLAEEYGIPFVVAVRATDLNFFRLRPLLRRRGIQIMQKAARVFFLSESTREFFFQKYVPQQYKEELFSKTEIIPNGIDDFWLQNRTEREGPVSALEEKKICICCVANLIRRKNVPELQKAAALLAEQGWDIRMEVIGCATDRKEYEKIIADPRTTYFEPEPKEKLIDHYRRADLFVLPSVQETFGLVYAEAMSQGLPVIYTKGEGFDGQFKDEIVGKAVKPEAEEIASAIQSMCDRYTEISHNCSELAARFDWNRIIQAYLQVYEQITPEEKQ